MPSNSAAESSARANHAALAVVSTRADERMLERSRASEGKFIRDKRFCGSVSPPAKGMVLALSDRQRPPEGRLLNVAITQAGANPGVRYGGRTRAGALLFGESVGRALSSLWARNCRSGLLPGCA